jgi:WD40 repeat protein/serine/threonine protein kinase
LPDTKDEPQNPLAGPPAAVENTATILQPLPADRAASAERARPAVGRLPEPGERLDQYEILRRLGQGGMGVVYLARDTQLGRLAALKVVHPELAQSADASERFLFEARVTARFNHPHIVTIYGVGQAGGLPYLTLEYLRGETLRERLRAESPVLNEILQIAVAVAKALQEAHRRQILHRDLKPENIFLPKDGRLRVLDFGLARFLEPEKPPAAAAPAPDASMFAPEFAAGPAREANRLAGTMFYMAPEQWRLHDLTPAVDVWALGVILFEMFAGRRPYAGASFEISAAVTANEPAPSLAAAAPDAPAAICRLVDRCLAKSPAERPTIDETLAELETLVGDVARRPAPGDAEKSPFRGLFPFRPEDADIFFGRDAEIAACVEKLRGQPLLAVVGASGAGKSSFVMAGVIPALETVGNWLFVSLRPGKRPFAALANSLQGQGLLDPRRSGDTAANLSAKTFHVFFGNRQAALADELAASPPLLGSLLRFEAQSRGRKALVVIDQFEELYSLGGAAEETRRFAEALCLAADDPDGPIRVVLTVRDDFLSHLAGHPGIAAAMAAGVVVLRTPNPEALAQTLIRPLAARQYSFEDEDLPREMVAAVAAEPAGLPFLQFAAQRLWEARDPRRRVLRRETYRQMGGVAGALADHADRVIDELGPGKDAIARAVLLRLITPDGTRRQTRRRELIEQTGPDAGSVLDKLVAQRLLVSRRPIGDEDDPRDDAPAAESTLELAHESLIARWDRLRRWYEESKDDIALFARLQTAAQTWIGHGRRSEDLWRGLSLAEADQWQGRVTQTLTPEIRHFLDQSRAAEARARRRKRIAQIALALVAVASLATAVYVSRQARAAREGLAHALLSDAAAAWQREDFPEARAKLRCSFEILDTPGARALWARIQGDPRCFVGRTGGLNYSVVFSGDGRQVVSSGAEPIVRIWTVATGEVRLIRNTGWENYALAVDFDGKRIAVGDNEGEVRLFATDGGESRRFRIHHGMIRGIRFDRKWPFVVSAATDGSVVAWDPNTGAPRWEIPAASKFSGNWRGLSVDQEGGAVGLVGVVSKLLLVNAADGTTARALDTREQHPVNVAFHPDGRRVASVGLEDGLLRIWDRQTGQLLGEAAGLRQALAISADGKLLASATNADDIDIRDFETLKSRGLLTGHQRAIQNLDFNRDGSLLASASWDRTVRVWRTGVFRRPETSHDQEVVGVAFSPDGRSLATGGWDKKVIVWDLNTGVGASLTGHEGPVREVAFSPDGRWLASASNDAMVRLWDRQTNATARILSGHAREVWGLRFSPDGKRLATASYDRTVRIWDVDSGRTLNEFSGADINRDILYTPDGRFVVVGGDYHVNVWDASKGVRTASFPVVRTNVCTFLALSPDGRYLASGSLEDRGGRIWDLQSGRLVQTLTGGRGPFEGVAFSADGVRLYATADDDVETWDWRNGVLLGRFRSPAASPSNVVASPDGRFLVWATGDESDSVIPWDLARSQPHWRAPLLLLAPRPLLLTKDGLRELAAASGREPAYAAIATLPANLREPVRAVDARAVAAAIGDDGRRLVFFTADGRVEFWDLERGARLGAAQVPGVQKALPLPDGFVTLAEGRIVRWGCGGEAEAACAATTLVETGATGLDVSAGKVLAAAAGRIQVFSSAGRAEEKIAAGDAITAMIMQGDRVVAGYRDGSLEIHSLTARGKGQAALLGGVSGTPVRALAWITPQILAAGFENGKVGLWNLDEGRLVDQFKLHGPIVHLVVRDRRLYAATILGDSRVEDLSAYELPYCAVLRQVWADIPVVWENEKIQLQPAPTRHSCR